jgi:hypothetical protein
MPIVHSVAEHAVGAMLVSIPATYSFRNIVLVGGGTLAQGTALESNGFCRAVVPVKRSDGDFCACRPGHTVSLPVISSWPNSRPVASIGLMRRM